jgi:hypothetical protein
VGEQAETPTTPSTVMLSMVAFVWPAERCTAGANDPSLLGFLITPPPRRTSNRRSRNS